MMNKRDFKDRVYGELAKINKALSNPHRLEIIELLAQAEYSVEQIAVQTNLSIANASQHLQVLKHAQLVDMQREGNFVYYRLANDSVFRTWAALRRLGVACLPSIERLERDFRKTNFQMESVSIEELIQKIESGRVTILDVRPEHEYRKGHIAQSLSIPMDELALRLKELPAKNEIVAYCRGPFCVFADEAVALLSREGYRAIRLYEGFPDWALRGLAVEAA